MTAILVNNLLKEEDIARQRSTLDNSIFAKLRQVSDTSRDEDQVHNLLFNAVALGRYIEPCLSEYAQTTQEKVYVQTYPSGTTVVKAFVANDFIFYNKEQRTIKDLNDASLILTKATLVKMTWQIQKSCQNIQAIMLVTNMANPAICPLCSAMQMVL
jgi:hypothetical protein